MKRILIICFTVSFLVSCNDPMYKTYTEDGFVFDMVEISDSKGEETAEKITGYVMMQTFKTALDDKNENDLIGKTYKQLLNEAENFEAEREKKKEEEKILALEEKKRRSDLSSKITDSLTFTLSKKGFAEYDYQDYLTFTFTFRNKTERDILGVKGLVIFYDIFDDEIKRLKLSYDDGIKGGKTVNYLAQVDYNQFITEDKKLKNTELDKLKVVWEPQKLIFSDGEKIILD